MRAASTHEKDYHDCYTTKSPNLGAHQIHFLHDGWNVGERINSTVIYFPKYAMTR